MKYCMGCMENIEDEVLQCPSCGFMQNNQNVQGLLQTGTILQNRYIVGRSIGNGGFWSNLYWTGCSVKKKDCNKGIFPKKNFCPYEGWSSCGCAFDGMPASLLIVAWNSF